MPEESRNRFKKSNIQFGGFPNEEGQAVEEHTLGAEGSDRREYPATKWKSRLDIQFGFLPMEDHINPAGLSGGEEQDPRAGPTPAKKKKNQRKNQKRRAKERAKKEMSKETTVEEEEDEEHSADSDSVSSSGVWSPPPRVGSQDAVENRKPVGDSEMSKLLDDMMDEIMNSKWGIRATTDRKVKEKQIGEASDQEAKLRKFDEHMTNDVDMVRRAMIRVVRVRRERRESISPRNSTEMDELLGLVLEAIEAELGVENK